jgi:DNA-binding response OmpR family regulator
LDGEKLRILVVEDERKLAAVIEGGLEEQGYAVDVAHDGADALAKAEGEPYDLVVLDLMLPNIDGLTVCARLRAEQRNMPVLMLTARDGVDDRVRGLDAGADDYLTKPFAFRELVARLFALSRRRPTPLPEIASVADLEVDLRGHRVRRAGRDIELTAKEFALLEFLVRHRDQVVDRTAITAHVWDENHDPFTNVLEVLVRRLRRKIDDGHDRKLIHTLRGAGYRFGR